MTGSKTIIKTWCMATLFTALATWLAQAALAQENPARRGLEAFNGRQYDAALAYFQQAEAAGEQSAALQYNIAVSLFRLGRLDEARERFLILAPQPDWTVLVNYNLGLVAEAEGDRDTAIAWYRQSLAQQEHAQIRNLAQGKLDRLQAAGPTVAGSARPWLGLVSLGGGHDSNASSLADDLLDNNSSAEDRFAEALLYGQWQLDGQARAGTRLFGLYFDRRFSEFDYLDTQVFGFGLVHERPFHSYQLEAGLRWTGTWLDSREVAGQWQAHAGVSRQLTPGTFGAVYAYSSIDAGSAFAQTDGDQHRLDLTWDKRLGALTLQGRYRHERNDRADLSRNGAFASYSPVRDSLSLGARWQFTPAFSAGATAEYIESDYDGVNRLRDTNGQVVTASRFNRQQRYQLDASYRFDRNWRIRGEYQHNDARDTFDLYTWDKNRVMGTAEYQF